MALKITNQKNKNILLRCMLPISLTTLLLFTPYSYAMPISIKYVEEIIVDEENIYVHYRVTCSDNTEVDISSWDNNKLWCVGKGLKDDCNKVKIKTAKQVCK